MSFCKKRAGTLFLSVLLLAAVACTPDEEPPPGYETLDGSRIDFSRLLGKVVLINYWAEWCTPCRQEIPALNALQEEFSGQVVVLGVNFDGVTGDELREQADKMGITFAQLTQDPRAVFDATPSGVLPETLVIDRRGKFQQVLLGPQSVRSLRHVVASLPEEMAVGE
ncbi:MAG: TlpA disulfide reductase family protein [Porticoccaceae bacterium]|nr:TlpA family protein disulfide reductase [Pseudomonadales bacterium]MCP5173119.1 TlpA family protein disulfide reductase [Pseudomonadales bacterium]